MHFVYLLRSTCNSKKKYVGLTDDVVSRLADHNKGDCLYTKKFRPWELVAYVAVTDRKQAATLEQYFKSGSGHAFAKRHLW